MTTLTITHAPSRWWQSRVMRRFLSHRLALLGLLMIFLLTLACVVGPHLLPYDSLYIDLRARFAPPFTGNHYLGTDPLGRDLAVRLLMAGRISLLVGFFAMMLSIFVGTLVGVIAGYRGGWIGAVLMRTVNGFLSYPTIFLLLALAAALKPSPVMITIIIAVTSWMEVARIVEAEVRSLKEREFVLAGHMLGLSRSHIMFREILPNAMGPIIVAATLTVARAILLEAYISFLMAYPTPAAAAQLGKYAEWSPAISGQCALVGDHSRCCDHHRRFQFQLHW